MQAILVLYFADTLAHGGMGMSAGTAASVSAAYGTLVYLVSVAGGWLADRILGSYRAVLWGGVLIACGHYAMAVPTSTMTWAGLGLISAGTGLLKPNVATRVGKLYRTDDERRDAGFALYYMAINIGAFAGLWFLSLALANGIQAQTVKLYDTVSKPAYFGVNGAIAVAAGLAVAAAAPWLRRTMHPVH